MSSVYSTIAGNESNESTYDRTSSTRTRLCCSCCPPVCPIANIKPRVANESSCQLTAPSSSRREEALLGTAFALILGRLCYKAAVRMPRSMADFRFAKAVCSFAAGISSPCYPRSYRYLSLPHIKLIPDESVQNVGI